MSFISFLSDLKAYVPTLGDILKIAAAQGTGLRSIGTNQGAANYITDETTVSQFDGFMRVFHRKTEQFYKEDKGALFYPDDLFQSGNEAYILFYMRDSVYRESKLMKRLALYMPPSVAVNYGANWQKVDMLITKNQQTQVADDASKILKLYERGDGSGAAEALKAAFGSKGNATGALLSAAMKSGAQTIMTNTSIGQAASYITQKSINPMSALSFTNINLRQFKFSFELMARSATESDSIRDIINCFKYGMHPGSNEVTDRPQGIPGAVSGAADKVFLDYPNTFDIYLFSPGTEYLFQIQRSVLVNMDVQYNGNRVASFFKGTGAPTNITLDLQFQETELLTKDRIVDGY